MLLYKKLIKELDYFIFDAYKINPAYLGLYRILYCILIFIFYGIPNFLWLRNASDYLFIPPQVSIANLFSGFPDGIFFIIASLAIAILYLMLLFGWKTKFTSIALFFLILFCQNFSYSLGKIDSNIIWLVIPLVMAFAGWGNTYSIDALQQRKSREHPWAISLLALLLGFGMFTASVPKILSGWLAPDSQATLEHLVYNALYWERSPLLLDMMLQIKSKFFWELLDYITIIFEFGFLLAVLRPQVFRFFVFSAVIFHIFVYLTFSIVFTHNLLFYLIFINWSIFNPLLKSASFNWAVTNLVKPKYLALSIGLVTLYGLSTIILYNNFEFLSIIELIFNALNMEEQARMLTTFILFSLGLIVAFASIIRFLMKGSKESTYQVLENTYIEKEVV